MEKVLKTIVYIFAVISVLLLALGVATFFVPESSKITIAWQKGRMLMIVLVCSGLAIMTKLDKMKTANSQRDGIK